MDFSNHTKKQAKKEKSKTSELIEREQPEGNRTPTLMTTERPPDTNDRGESATTTRFVLLPPLSRRPFSEDQERTKTTLQSVMQRMTSNGKKLDPAGYKVGGAAMSLMRYYLPFYGVTCVLHLTKESLESFGKPLHAALSRDHRITSSLALLPPESYHVTLRGLEPCLPRFSPEYPPEAYTALAKQFYEAQAALDNIWNNNSNSDARPSVSSSTTGMTIEKQWRLASLAMKSLDDATEKQLRLGEDSLQESLLKPVINKSNKTKIERKQSWHLSLGYETTKDDASLKLAKQAIDKVLEAFASTGASSAKQQGGIPPLTFLQPDICHYSSMEHFEPLFPLLAKEEGEAEQ